jgi:hypothetical protein
MLHERNLLCMLGCLLVVSVGAGASAKGPAKADRNRTQVFVVSMSDDLSHQAGLINQMLRKVLHEVPNIQILDLAEQLQPPPPENTRKFLEEARNGLKAAKTALREMEYQQAVKNAGRARVAFEKMGGYLAPLKRYKEAILLVAVGECMQGNTHEAESSFLDLLLLDSHLRLGKGAYEGFVIDLFNKVKASLAKQPRGSLAIKTQPPGGNLYLDGKLKGVTPDSLDGLVAGNHLVVVKMPGHQNWGKVVRVDAGGLVSLDIKLVPGKAGSGFTRMVERAGRAVSDVDLRSPVLRLGQALGMDWVWLCQLEHESYDLVLTGYLFEFSLARVFHKDKLELESSGYGIEEEVRKFGRKFMREGMLALKKLREEGDPLRSHTGTEDWYRDDSEKAREHREIRGVGEKRKKGTQEESGDPLDEKDGTEDW